MLYYSYPPCSPRLITVLLFSIVHSLMLSFNYILVQFVCLLHYSCCIVVIFIVWYNGCKEFYTLWYGNRNSMINVQILVSLILLLLLLIVIHSMTKFIMVLVQVMHNYSVAGAINYIMISTICGRVWMMIPLHLLLFFPLLPIDGYGMCIVSSGTAQQ